MSDRITIKYPRLIQQYKQKKRGKTGFVGLQKLVQGGQEKHYAGRLLAHAGLEDVEEPTFPFCERRERLKITFEQLCARVLDVAEESGNLLENRIESWKVTIPDRSERLFWRSDVDVAQAYLPQGGPGFSETRGQGEYEELVAECNQLKLANARLARRLSDAVTDRDLLHADLIARKNGQLRMTESYEGIVRHVGRNDVVVLFEVEHDFVEHTYTRDQFLDSQLPEKGDRLVVYVHVAQLPPEESAEATDKPMEGIDEQPRRRRNIGKGPREF